jgi:hypothetical protein
MMELWILLGLLVVLLAVGAGIRLGKRRRRGDDAETKNIYPLW